MECKCSGATRRCDSSEVRAIDIESRISPLWSVQDVHDIHSEFKLLRFGNPYALNQVHIQAEFGRPLNPPQAKITKLPRGGISQKNLPLAICNRIITELIPECIRGGDISDGWVGDLLESIKIGNHARRTCAYNLSDILWEIAYNHWSLINELTP